MHVNAAAAHGAPRPMSAAALTGVPKIEHDLAVEVKRTTQ